MDPELVGVHPPPQMSFSKSFDQFCPMGPCIVSKKVDTPTPVFLDTIIDDKKGHRKPP